MEHDRVAKIGQTIGQLIVVEVLNPTLRYVRKRDEHQLAAPGASALATASGA